MSNTSKPGDALREQAAQHERDAVESFERSDTDGFVSQWGSSLNAQVDRANAQIADDGGVARFERTVLVTADGEPTDARCVSTRYGLRWRLDSTPEWLPYRPARESTLGKRGYREVIEEIVAPAKAQTWAPGNARGLSGATAVVVRVFRTDELPGGGRERNEWRHVGRPVVTVEEPRRAHETTSAEFILRVRVPIALADKAQGALEPLARKLGGRLSRVERADYADHAIHLRRKRVV
jgi:hypothetical protein